MISWILTTMKGSPMPNFLNYPKVNNVGTDESPYSDARSHCVKYDYYSGGGRVTSVHECTHGINSQIRNKPIRINDASEFRALGFATSSPSEVCMLPQPAEELTPDEEEMKMMVTGAQAGFYLLQDKAIMFENPAGTISQAAAIVPRTMRYGRYNLYMVQQARSWNAEPLYIFDEWIAYRNGAACLIYDATHGGTREGNTDFIFGPLEFCTYGICIMKSAAAQGPISDELKEFTNWLLTDCFNIYFEGKAFAPWADADKLYQQFLNGEDAAELRQFCSDQLAFQIPTGVVTPSTTLDWIM